MQPQFAIFQKSVGHIMQIREKTSYTIFLQFKSFLGCETFERSLKVGLVHWIFSKSHADVGLMKTQFDVWVGCE